MGGPPDDMRARRESLERWLAEQRETDQGEERISFAKRRFRRAGLKVALNLQRAANRVLGHGLDTSSHVRLPEHDHPDRVQYIPTAWHVLPRALRYLGVSGQDVFADFGCGKGRVLHQAAKRPFRRVIGVEISAEIAEVARANLARRRRQQRCRDIELVVTDVADFRVPDDLTLGFFFHSFKNERLDALLGTIIDSITRGPRRVRLIYVFPLNGSQVLATGRFKLLKEQWTPYLDTPGSRVAIYESR